MIFNDGKRVIQSMWKQVDGVTTAVTAQKMFQAVVSNTITGKVAINVTVDGTPNGTAIFNNLDKASVFPSAMDSVGSIVSLPLASWRFVNSKQIEIILAESKTTTLLQTIGSVEGLEPHINVNTKVHVLIIGE